jgi:hypothetical protein
MSDKRSTAERLLAALDKDPELRAEVAKGLTQTPRLVFCQDWEESERGWGVRPDGHTLHLTREDRDAYVKGYNAAHNNEPTVPYEYTRTSGDPRLVEVDEETYQKLVAHRGLPADGDDITLPHQRLGIWGHHRQFGPRGYAP